MLFAAATGTVVKGHSQHCHVCKTPNAADVFANLHCDEIPDTAPDCSLTTRDGGQDFLQNCPDDYNCLTITSKDEELRMCTQKQRMETMETTDGVVMEVCGSDRCNAATQLSQQASLALLLAIAVVLTQQLV